MLMASTVATRCQLLKRTSGVDVGRTRLLERIDAALRALAMNPGDERCRRRSYSIAVAGMWGMPVRSRDEDWLILGLAGPGDDEVTVIYVGPDL